MKCLHVPLEREELPYHRRKSYLAYKVTCRGKKERKNVLILSNWIFLQYLDFSESRIMYMLLFLLIKSFKLEKALVLHPVVLPLSLQSLRWKWSRTSLLVYERVGILFQGWDLPFFLPTFTVGFFCLGFGFLFLKLTFVSRFRQKFILGACVSCLYVRHPWSLEVFSRRMLVLK